jgi:AraC-like DNA-binding protein
LFGRLVADLPNETAMHASLPPLAFGNSSAQASDDLSSFLAVQRAAMTGIRRYEPLRSKHGFRHRAAQVRVADVLIVASASTPLAVEADFSAETTLLVPFHGWGTSLVDGREHRWQAGNSAMFLPGSARTGESGVRSVVAITLDPRRLAATARSMLGPHDSGRIDLGLASPRLIPLGAGNSPGLALLKQVLSLLDHAGDEERNLRMLGIDDTLHRIVALVLAPRMQAWSAGTSRQPASAAAVRRVMEFIVAHLDEPISLGDLERVSGLAARTLQVAFRKSLNCSPRAWIQQRRLLLARERLLSGAHVETVAAVANSCGFTRLGAFAAAYARRFGESPSETLRRHRRDS